MSLLIRTIEEKSVVILHPRLVAALAVLGALSVPLYPAQAGLLGVGRTVQATFYLGSFASAENEIPVGGLSGDPTSLAAAVDYQSGLNALATIHVGDTQIVITNEAASAPFCSTSAIGAACTDAFTGFGFKFTGESLLGVSVDPSSAPGMLPVSGTFQSNTHLGLQLLSANEIRIDLTGDLPLVNDKLVLDLSFASVTNPPPTDAPEPATLTLLGLALVALGASRRWVARLV